MPNVYLETQTVVFREKIASTQGFLGELYLLLENACMGGKKEKEKIVVGCFTFSVSVAHVSWWISFCNIRVQQSLLFGG